MNDKGVCRTAPATPGLLKMFVEHTQKPDTTIVGFYIPNTCAQIYFTQQNININ